MAGIPFYGTPGSDTDYPAVQIAALQAIKYHICTALYPDEVYASDSSKRFVKANFESGTEHAIRASIKQFDNVMGEFPFTAYNIGEDTLIPDKSNMLEKGGTYYSKTYDTYAKSMYVEWEIPMMSFFAQPSDYFHAKTILMALASKLQRMIVPIEVNGTLDSFEANVEMEISKGNFAFSTIEQEDRGDIFDISHTCSVKMHYYVFDSASLKPVDDIELALNNLLDDGYLFANVQHDFLTAPDTPQITSVSPVDEETNVDIDSTITNIIINFNIAMDEASVEDAIDFYPVISGDYNWSSDSTQLIIDLVEDLVASTEYTLEINNTAKSIWTHPIIEDYEWTFTTT